MDTIDETSPAIPPAGEWVFLEVMGHRSHYGLLTEIERFGAKMSRIDVFGVGATEPEATHFYGGPAIFSITPTTEETCRQQTDRWKPRPATVKSLPPPDDDDRDDDDWMLDLDMEAQG